MSEFQQISFNGSGALQKYISLSDSERNAFLESLDWYKSLPTDHRYKCQACQDTGVIIDNGDNRARTCPCVAGIDPKKHVPNTYFVLDENLRGWEGWPVMRPREFENMENFTETETYLSGRKLIDDIQGGGCGALLLCGANGRGKTYTGLIILAEAAWSGKKCHAVKMKKLVELLKGGIDTRQEFQHEMNRIFSSSVVLIDEITSGYRQGDIDHGQRVIDDVVHEFHSQKKTLILTSNAYKTELVQILGKATISRISQCAGWCTVVEEAQGSENLRGKLVS